MTRNSRLIDGSQRLGSLDGMRGIAILSVIFLHWIVRPYRVEIGDFSPQLYEVLNQSAHGVDIFFVISGFLIGRILLTNAGRPGLLRAFYMRRFFRIIPLYFAVICVFLAVRTLVGAYPEGVVPSFTYFIFVNNVAQAFGADTIPEFGPYWSLAIEEQFYLVSALLAVAFGRRGVVVLAACFIVGSIGVRCLFFIVPTGLSWWPFTLGHSDPIGIGLLLAAILTRRNWPELVTRHINAIKIAGVCAGAAFLATSWHPPAQAVGLDITLISAAVACWMAVTLLPESRSMFAFPPLVRIGEMCFSLYILHEGWRFYVSTLLGAVGFSQWAVIIVSFGLLVAFCRFLWLHFEAPLIAYGRSWRYGEPLAPAEVARADAGR
jgi:peptidoglycan/LPS O-acetylase OafA/YrhL